MCFLRLLVLKIHTVVLCLIVLICNICNLFYGVQLVNNFYSPAKNLLTVSILLDSVLFVTTCLGIYGVLFHKKWPLKLYIFTLIAFFISKVLIADQAVGFEIKFYSTFVSPWYHMETALSVLCLIFVFSFYLKLDSMADFRRRKHRNLAFYFRFQVVRYLTLSVIIAFAAFNVLENCASVMCLYEGPKQIRIALIVSLVMNIIAYMPIVTGFNGTYRNNIYKMQRFIVAMLAYFAGKIVLSKCLVLFEEANIELIISYQLCVITSGLCFVFAIPLSLKLLEKENQTEIQV